MMDLQEWALNRFSPVVMVMATPNAEAMCEAKNGLSVTDMLRPYGAVHNISVPVRTVGDQSIRINGFKLRLHEASTVFQPSVEAAESHLSQVLSASAEEHGPRECMQSMEDIRSAVATGRDLTPWFSTYRDEMYRLLSFSDFETFDHPVACLFVGDANTDEFPSAFQQLDRPEAYPWLMRHGVMDPSMLKHHIILCDNSQGSEERAKARMSSLLAPVYGANNVHVLKINSGTGSPADSGGVADIWRSCQLPSVPGGGAGEPETRLGSSAGAATADADDVDLGLNLTASDLEGIALFMRDFTMRSLLPFLEGRIRALNLQINATRRGLKNSLKALWWRKERSDVPDSDKSPAAAAGMYNYSTVESQLRCLSDLSFMVRDYGLASSTLRLLQGDYKADKALRHFAGAQEMLALSLMMSGEGGSGREMEDCLMQAYGAYSQCGGGYMRYATRSMLHLTEIHKRAGRFREAKASLMKAHFEEVHVRAALLLEQTAVCLLKSEPPLERKFAFHLVLAGLRFHQCDQRLLAERAYSQVLTVYNGRNWSLIEEHLNDVLGRYSQDKGDIQTTVKHTMALLGSCMHRNGSVQEHYMRQFCEAVKESERRLKAAGKEAELPLRLELPLPAVAADSAFVHVDGVRYKGNAAAYEVEDAVWDRMHEALCTGGAAAALGNSASSNWLAGRSAGEALVSNVCCVNEEVGVDIEFSNPLSITLQVTDIRLLCELDASPAPSSASSAQDPSNAAAQLAFTVRPQQLTLRSKEKSKLGLMVTPLVPGLLRVLGVEWCLNGAVNGRRLFQQRTEPRWKGDTSHQRLMFSVITPMPRLAATVHGLPSVLYAGELTRCFLELRNCGDVPMKGLRIAVSHPGEVLCSSRPISSRAEATTSLDEAWQDEADVPGTWLTPEEGRGPETAQLMPLAPLPSGEKPSRFYSAATRVWRLPKDTVLEEGGEAFWPIWICPARQGTHAFELAIYFEKSGGGAEGVMKHRVLCIGQTMSVVPSLQVQVSVMSDATQLRRHLLQLSVHNFPQANESFRIRQISCITPGVELQKIPGSAGSDAEEEGGHRSSMDIRAEAEVAAGDTSSLFLHIEKRDSEGAGAATPGPGILPVRSGALHWFNACATDAAARGASGALRGGVRGSVAAALGTVLMGLQVKEPEEVRAKVVVVWEVGTKGRTRRLGAVLAERLEGPSDPQQPQLPLRAALKGPHIVTHDFASSPLCVVPLSLSVANSLPYATAVSVDCGAPGMAFLTPTAPGTWHHAEDAAVTSSAAAAAASSSSTAIALAQSSSSDGAPSRQCALTPSGRWQWCGQSHSTLGPLQPGAAAEARLQVVAFAPGHFHVGGYRLAYSEADLLSPDGTLEGPSCTVTVVHKQSSSGVGEPTAAPPPTPAAPTPAADDQTHETGAAIVASGTDVGPFVDEADQQAASVSDDQAAGAEEAAKEKGMLGVGEEDENVSTVEDDTAADGSCLDEADMDLMTDGLDTL